MEDNGWSEHVAIKYVKTFLTGKAADWFKLEVRPCLTRGTTWKDFFKMFEENYLGAADRQRTRRLVNEYKQGQYETVSTFIPGFKRLLYLLNPDLSDAEIVERVTEKLRPKYRKIICEKEPKTLRELRDVCRRLEAGLEACRDHQSGNKQTQDNRSNQRNNNPNSRPRTSQETNQEKSNKQEKDVSLVCSRCDYKGHKSNQCYAKKKRDGTILPNVKNAVLSRPEGDREFFIEQTSDDEGVITIQHPPNCAAILVNNASTSVYTPSMQKEIRCNGISILGIVDTGGQVSLISSSTVSEHNFPISNNTMDLLSADGKIFQSPGFISVDVSLRIGRVEK